jgi:regulator of sigma E protease
MNVLLAVVVATLLAYHYGQLVYPGTVIGAARAPAGAPELAQLQSGDSIRTINGVAVRTWNDVRKGITSSIGTVAIATQRGEVRIPLGREKGSADDIADGLIYYLAPVIDTVFPGDRAARLGSSTGFIVNVAGHPVRSWSDMVEQVGKSPDQPVTFVIRRGPATDTIVVTPKSVKEPDPATGRNHRRTHRGGSTRPVAARNTRVRRRSRPGCGLPHRTPALCSGASSDRQRDGFGA